MIIFGTRLYGKVDQVPGLFYVATTFVHLQFIPFVPMSSYLVLAGNRGAYSIGLSWKSVLFAWARAGAGIAGVVLVILALMSVGGQLHGKHVWLMFAVSLALGVGLLVFVPLSYRLSRAGPHRALKVATRAGLDPQRVADYLVDKGLAPPLDEVLPADPEF